MGSSAGRRERKLKSRCQGTGLSPELLFLGPRLCSKSTFLLAMTLWVPEDSVARSREPPA